MLNYKNQEYKTRSNFLKVLNASVPIQREYKRLIAEYTSDIDFTPVLPYEERLNELITAIEQCKDDESRIDDITKWQKEVKEINEQLQEWKHLYDFKREQESYVLIEIATNEKIMKPFLTAYLEGDIEFIYKEQDTETLKFLVQVLTDFFLGFGQMINKYKQS